jgi:hypothetical protein
MQSNANELTITDFADLDAAQTSIRALACNLEGT